MLGKGHAVSGATIWLTGWAWTDIAGLSHPHPDVIVVGGLVCAGAALLPDLDHPDSRLAHAGGDFTEKIAHVLAWLGRNIHAATKLDADRPDEDGHRTITHTAVFAVLAGCLTAGISGLSDNAGAALAAWTGLAGLAPLGKLLTGVLVFLFVRLGYAAARAAFPGRRKRVKLGVRWRKDNLIALLCALTACALVPPDVWWLGLAVGIGCGTHLAGDVITASGCPVLWPLPVPSRTTRYDRKQRARVPVTVWRTWYLVGTPQWMRFPVGSATERWVTWGIVGLGALAIVGLCYATWRGVVPA